MQVKIKDFDKPVTKIEIPLLDYGGLIDNDVKFKRGTSGIELSEFRLGKRKVEVVERLQYKPWMNGVWNPGAGQIGIYKLRTDEGKEFYAVIKDYRAFEGDWRIFYLLGDRNLERLKEKISDYFYF